MRSTKLYIVDVKSFRVQQISNEMFVQPKVNENYHERPLQFDTSQFIVGYAGETIDEHTQLVQMEINLPLAKELAERYA